MTRYTFRTGKRAYMTESTSNLCFANRPVKERAFCIGCSGSQDRKKCGALALIDRLADYEDTGLEPEEIKAMIPPPNDPLTLEELREMDGEPVWWWNTNSEPVCMICSFKRLSKNPAFINFDFIEDDCTDITNYEYLRKCGYKAYRRKPEEGAV